MPVSTMGTQSSQEIHSQVLNAILAPIRDLNENWKVDLSAHLETYLQELCDPHGALGSVNFVEAALLIQRSAGIFGKKVEYLWQLLMQVLESFQKKGVQGEKGNERRKRAATVSDLLQDFVEIPISIDKKIWKGKAFPVKLEPPYYSELEYNCPREKKLSLFDHMMDPVGDKSDFRLNFAISDSYTLAEELSHIDCGSGTEEVEDASMEDDGCDGNDFASHIDDVLMEVDENIDVGLNGNPDTEISPLQAESEPEPNTHEAADSEHAGRENQVAHVADHEERIVTVNDKVSWVSVAGDIPDKAMKVQDRCKAPELKRSCDTDSVSSLVSGCSPINFRKPADDAPKFRIEFHKKKKTKEQRKLEEIEAYRTILASDFDGDFLGFEDYDLSSGEEDGFHGYPDDDVDDEDAGALPDQPLPEPEPIPGPSSAVDPMPLPNVAIPSDTNDWTQVYQNILQEKMHSARIGNQDAQAALASRVNAWHDSIRQKLKMAEERGSMDIHEYGTYVLQTFPKGTAKTTIDFADVVAGKEQEEVCRYFLATLMLANTYNVQISKTNPEDLAMNCMELTLLKSTRHHEALDEYQAPSQRESLGTEMREEVFAAAGSSSGARRPSKGKGKSTKTSGKSSSKSSKR